MILVDTGPLIALLDADDIHHERCVATAKRLPAIPLLTSWPCFTEAMYLLGAIGGYNYQAKLWALYLSRKLILHDLSNAEVVRMAELMEAYHDTPMDMADASLIVIAENQGIHQVFSLDSDFYIYRMADGSILEPWP